MTTRTRPARPATREQLDWLTDEVRDWESHALLTQDQATTILAGYRVTAAVGRRFSLARLLLMIGAAFLGVGLIWLVAANLDQLAPMTRFIVVAALWLAFLVGSEVMHARRPAASLRVGAGRLLAALVFGAVVFQAAQSMQVPAYEPALVGLWGAGALIHAYAVRGTAPLVVGITAGTVWWVWQPVAGSLDMLTGVLALAAGSVLAAAVAVLHDAGHAERDAGAPFGTPWRYVSALLALTALFVAALPDADAHGFSWTPWLVGYLAIAGVATAAAVVRAQGWAWLEPAGALAVLAVSALAVLWDAGNDVRQVGLEDWAHAGLSVAAYAGLAVGLAALGTVRGSWPLTALATGALVVFTTSQSFAVFAQIVQGAWLFVVLGGVLLGTGYLFDRARRELAATLEGVDR